MLKVTGGEYRGRRFHAPQGHATRPTAEKVRQAIYDTLYGLVELDGVLVLDLYAGSGALGIEALSRGAARAVFVEAHARTAAGIGANLQRMNIPPARWKVAPTPVKRWLACGQGEGPVGLVLADPPYAAPEALQLLEWLAPWPLLAPRAVIVLETAADQSISLPPSLELLQIKRYHQTWVRFLTRYEAKQPPP